MEILHYVAYFFAGMFLTNGIPHFVMGSAGRGFPTPFAKPPGRGESSAMVNVFWGFANFVVGYLLLQVGAFRPGVTLPMCVFGLGVLAMGYLLARHFGEVYGSGAAGT